MRQLRTFMKARGIDFPTTNELLEERKTLHPPVQPVLDGRGVCVDPVELIRETTEALVKAHAPPNLRDNQLRLVGKHGGDGAGCQQVWKSVSMNDAESHMFQYGFVPLRLETANDQPPVLIWKNPVPNSPLYLRPIYLIREVEKDESLNLEVLTKMDNAVELLRSQGIRVAYKNSTVNVKCILHDSMKDLGWKKHICGLGGADCILCKSKQKDWTNPDKVRQGFPINRSAADTEALYHRLVEEDGEIPRSANDFETRQGLTQMPLTKSDQRNITITHTFINGASCFFKFLIRVVLDYRHWIEHKDPRGQPLRNEKARLQKHIRDKTGLRIDECASSGFGGTSTDGNTGRRFLSAEMNYILQEKIPNIRPDTNYKENAILFHVQLSTIVRLISSTEKINIQKFEELCEATSLNLADNFPWARLNFTLHGAIQHSAQLIRENDNCGLGELSEEPLEANNKDIRKFLGNLSRTCDPVQQMTDTAHRLLERSHPDIRLILHKLKRPKKCSECGSTEHTIKTHYKSMGAGCRDRYDTMVHDIILE